MDKFRASCHSNGMDKARPGPRNLITDVPGLTVGQAQDEAVRTGVTVILPTDRAVCAVDVRGGGPGTRETDALDPENLVGGTVDAVVLSGGSMYGLAAGDGVAAWLGTQGRGYPVSARPGVPVAPIVPAAILFDLPVGGNPKIRPTADCGYRAAEGASTAPVPEGTIGAGAGATVGKSGGGPNRSMKSGLGSYSITLPNGLTVGAIVAVNAVRDILEPDTGKVAAGSRTPDGREKPPPSPSSPPPPSNT